MRDEESYDVMSVADIQFSRLLSMIYHVCLQYLITADIMAAKFTRVGSSEDEMCEMYNNKFFPIYLIAILVSFIRISFQSIYLNLLPFFNIRHKEKGVKSSMALYNCIFTSLSVHIYPINILN